MSCSFSLTHKVCTNLKNLCAFFFWNAQIIIASTAGEWYNKNTKNIDVSRLSAYLRKRVLGGISPFDAQHQSNWGSRGREFKSRHSDQVMIIRTTLSKWVMCSDLSFLSRIFFDGQGRELISALVYLLFIHPNS